MIQNVKLNKINKITEIQKEFDMTNKIWTLVLFLW